MPPHVIAIDVVGVILMICGFVLAFRQTFVRRLLNRPLAAPEGKDGADSGGDALSYILRLGGVMLLLFGLALGGMFTLFNLAGSGLL